MAPLDALLSLLQMANEASDVGVALDEMNRAILELTESRNAILARLNDDRALLEVVHGAGPDWDEAFYREQIDVSLQNGIIAYVAATGHPFIANDVQLESNYRCVHASTRSEAAAPIRDRHGRIEGVLNLESDRVNHFTPDRIAHLRLTAEIAGMLLQREAAERREVALVEIGHALDRAMSVEEVIQEVLIIANEVLRFQAFAVFVHDEPSDRFWLRGAVGRLKSQVGEISFTRGEGLTGWVAHSGRPWLTHDPTHDPRWLVTNNEFPDEQIASFLAVPVVYRGRCMAVLRVIRRTTNNHFLDNRFTADDLRVLTAIAEQMANALESIRAVGRLVQSERMAAWGELSAKSSHMIGNRLFALKGDVNELGHLLQEGELNRATLQELHQSLDRNVLRVEEILQDFRDFVTATQVQTTPTSLSELVEATVREVFPRRTSIQLEFDLSDNLPPLAIDPRRMRRAISELVENATSFLKEGKLRIETGWADPTDQTLGRVNLTTRYARIVVQDTGPGVATDVKTKIFQPFFSGRVKGMGLGLSIVQGVIAAHGGTVFEAGVPGQGAKFVILLPAPDRS